MIKDQLYLAHHGIHGQKWGVQHGPPYPLDAKTWKSAQKQQYSTNKVTSSGNRPEQLRRKHTIPAGTTIYRTTANKDEENKGATYVSYLDSDRNHYKGGWIRQMSGGKQTYENEYTLTKDLVVPSRDELYSVINDVVSSNQKLINQSVNAWLEQAMPKGSMDRYYATLDSLTGKEDPRKWKKFVDEAIKKYGDKSASEAGYYVSQTFGTNTKVRDMVISELKKRGYNAMTDEASVGGQNGWAKEGSDPLIVFDGADSLYKQKTSTISAKDERKALASYQSWNKKANKSKSGW